MQYLKFYIVVLKIKYGLRNRCKRCFRELTFMETDLFNEDDNAICRDCWINENFEPTSHD